MLRAVTLVWIILVASAAGFARSPLSEAGELLLESSLESSLESPLELQLDNELRNSGFEEPTFWITKGDARIEAALGRGGTGGVRLFGEREYQSEVVQTVGPRLVPGRRYTVTAWVRATTEDAIAVIGVRWDGGHPRVFRGVSPKDGWSKIEFRFVAPSVDGWRQVVLSGAGGLIWDDVNLYEAQSLEERLAETWEERLTGGAPVYTGLVVNAKGTRLERGMNPKIYDENGQLVFAGIGAGERQLYTEGIVAYATELASGTAHPRLEVSEVFPLRLPLVVDAQGTRGLPRVDVVVGNVDAERIRAAVQEYDFLGRFAIVFVLEPFSGL